MSVLRSFRTRLALAGLLAAALAAACGAAALHPNAGDAEWASDHRWPGTTVADLETGRSIFSSKCVGCHGLPRPDSKTSEEWPGVLDEMAARSKLSEADRDLVLRYLSAASARLRPNGG